MPWHIDKVSPSLVETIDSLEVSDPLPPLPATGWEETALLAAAMAADQEQFVANLLPQNLPLAARCAAAPEVTVSDALVERLQQDLWERIGDPKADLRARIVAAEVLGELGDPVLPGTADRMAITCCRRLPPLPVVLTRLAMMTASMLMKNRRIR